MPHPLEPTRAPLSVPLTRIAEAGMASPHVDRAAEELLDVLKTGLERLDAGEAGSRDAGRTLGIAQAALVHLGFHTIRDVRMVLPENMPARVPASRHEHAALALELLGWHRHLLEPGKRDVAMQYLDRAAVLSPLNELLIGRLAWLSLELSPDDLPMLASKPDRQASTLAGYKERAKDFVEFLLAKNFGIGEQELRGNTARSRIGELPEERLGGAYGFLDQYAMLQLHVGVFHKSEPLLTLSLAARGTQLELLGLPRDVATASQQIVHSVRTHGPDVFGENRDFVIQTLDGVAAAASARSKALGGSNRSLEIADAADAADAALDVLDVLDPRAPDEN